MSYMISTRGRYALRAMIDLAEQETDRAVPLRDIAERQGISLKYLEAIMPGLKDSGLVIGTAGKGGGYKLAKPASEYSIAEILEATEDQLAPVACLGDDFKCERADVCKTLPMWRKLNSMILDYLESVKLTDLM